MTEWHVYLVRTRLDTLYAGIATDVARRFAEHQQGGPLTAKYLRAKGPLQLVYQAKIGYQELARRVEWRIKNLPKPQKEQLVRTQPDTAILLELLRLSAKETLNQ